MVDQLAVHLQQLQEHWRAPHSSASHSLAEGRSVVCWRVVQKVVPQAGFREGEHLQAVVLEWEAAASWHQWQGLWQGR